MYWDDMKFFFLIVGEIKFFRILEVVDKDSKCKINLLLWLYLYNRIYFIDMWFYDIIELKCIKDS